MTERKLDPFHRPLSPETGVLPDREEQPLLGGSLLSRGSSLLGPHPHPTTGAAPAAGGGLAESAVLIQASAGSGRVLRSAASRNLGGGVRLGSGGVGTGRGVVGVDVESPKGSPGRSVPFMPNRKRSTKILSKGSAGTDELDPTLPSAHGSSSESLSTAQWSSSGERMSQLANDAGLQRSNSIGPSSGARARVVQGAEGTTAAAAGPASVQLNVFEKNGRHLEDGSARQNIQAQVRSHAARSASPMRSASPTRPPSPTKEGGLRLGAVGSGPATARLRNGISSNNANRARPLSMYDMPASSSTPFEPASSTATATAEDAVAKKRKQMAAAKRLKDAREGNLVASVASGRGGASPLVSSASAAGRREPMGASMRNNIEAADPPRRRLHPQQSFKALPQLDAAQVSVLDSIALPIMDDEDQQLDAETSFVYDVDAHGQAQDTDASDPFRSEGAAAEDSVQVHVRIRPPGEEDDLAWDAHIPACSVSLAPALAQSRVGVTTTAFNFDGVHTSSANKPIYLSVARPLIRSVLNGYDAVVFAYGQTGSGKTWTLSGDDDGYEPGIIPRAIRDIFAGIRQASTTREFLIRVSYMEVYNEQLKDLLMPSNAPQVRDATRGGRRGTVVKPLQEEVVTTPAQVMALLALGQANRHVGATDWNERSSRSHTAFKMTIESWERVSDEPWATETDPDRVPGSPAKQRTQGRTVRVSELSLIDLAGSERYFSKGGSAARSEGSAINKSLLCLGRVIAALSAAKEGQHVPFRDSKLTRILQNSLSGNARVAVVCTLNPSSNAVEESFSTLSFAKRVKKVALNAQRNEIDAMASLGTEGQALVQRYRSEAESLRRQVRELEARSMDDESSSATATVAVDDERIQELRQRLEQIGGLIMVGGGEEEPEDDEDDGRRSPFKRPMSPTKRGFRFDETLPVLQEKLFKANTRVQELESRLAGRPSLPPAAMLDSDKDALIRQLKTQVHELELVCEAQTAQGPLPRTNEDVEKEWQKKVADLQAELSKRDRFVLDLSRECHSLRSTNRQLMRIAHLDTANAILSLGSPGPAGSTPKFSDTAVPQTPPPRRTRARVPRRSVSMACLLGDESRLI